MEIFIIIYEHKNKKSICINLYYILQKLYWHQAWGFFDSHMEMYTHIFYMIWMYAYSGQLVLKKSL